ncbi:serine hydrolase domain-containing protein [Ilumatobacter sp.]|uniref:serine hydrolase domain-containing protein n=1 Tax=Ilumatobacter sp. TaxID=1967498 RepID=UPI003AF7FB7E
MSPDPVRLDATPLGEFVSSFAAERHCPTLAWGVVLGDTLAASGAVGDANEHTVYRIASMTKSFSAAATLLLRDEGVLRLDDPIAEHAPELAALDRFDSAPITVRDLLSMTSGLPTDDAWADRHLDLTDDDLDRILREGLVFARPTGNAFEYSNLGYAFLGRVIHRASGRRIQDVISDRLLAPLGMTATTWNRPDHDDWARPKRWLDGHGGPEDGRYVDELEPLGDGVMAAMGGIWTTVADLARWVGWLDDAFPARDDADTWPLSRASRREMQSAQQYIGFRTIAGVREPYSYGYGLVLADDGELGPSVTHAGGLPGYGSNMRWLPGRRVGVIALANSTYAPMLELTARILGLVDEQGVVPPARTPATTEVEAAASRLVALLNGWNDRDAVDLLTSSCVLDDSLGRRAAAAAALIAETGTLSIGSVEATSAAGARLRCGGSAGGDVTISFLLAPRRPPRIQSYTVTLDAST